ncbi:MAG: phosphoribosylformylglycinamidine synthase II [Myxococcales bacterium]|nr:phosphoribosylformylglycinamidine synthase II [Myxococcales bacterium]
METESIVDEELAIRLGLTASEYEEACRILDRTPTFTEIGIFSAMWNEHCSYKSSKFHLRRFHTEGDQVICGPGENAGIVDAGDGVAIVFKMESHNHPSFIEPYQGAATGVGGILRDVFTMGARPIANLNALRFGQPEHPKSKSLVEGVVAGIAGYGNCMGVPTVGGEVGFDACYNGNILVNAMTVGVAPTDKIFYGTASGPGNRVLYFGARTGRDGIGGATMASGAFDSEVEADRPTVQVGDPFYEKLLLEACLELFQTDAVVGIQDMGAAGLTSSSFEMAGRAGTGVDIDLDRVPTREPGMTAFELMLSESQERMLAVVPPERVAEVQAIFEKWDLECVDIGRVTADGMVTIRKEGVVKACLPAGPLSEASPVYQRPLAEPADWAERLHLAESDLPSLDGVAAREWILRLAADPNVASKRWVYQQYDHHVRLGTVTGPGGDGAMIRLPNGKGMAVTADCNPSFVYLHPRVGGAMAVAEAARNVACVGARPLAITDCMNFGNPEHPEVMWQFSESVDGISEATRALNCPVVSGNVSFYNTTDGRNIHPTPSVGMVGLASAPHSVKGYFQEEGLQIALLGDGFSAFGGSLFQKQVVGAPKGQPPTFDATAEAALIEVLVQSIEAGEIASAHDLSVGGLAMGLVRACVGGPVPLGANIVLPEGALESVLFAEDGARALVAVAAEHVEAVTHRAKAEGVLCRWLGQTGGDTLEVAGLPAVALEPLVKAYRGGFVEALGLDDGAAN